MSRPAASIILPYQYRTQAMRDYRRAVTNDMNLHDLQQLHADLELLRLLKDDELVRAKAADLARSICASQGAPEADEKASTDRPGGA